MNRDSLVQVLMGKSPSSDEAIAEMIRRMSLGQRGDVDPATDWMTNRRQPLQPPPAPPEVQLPTMQRRFGY